MELEITQITEENKREKLKNTANVLAYLFDIPLVINGIIQDKNALHTCIKAVIGKTRHDGKEETISVPIAYYPAETRKDIPILKKALNISGISVPRLPQQNTNRCLSIQISSAVNPPADTGIQKCYPNIMLDIQHITALNRYKKCMKAVKAVASQLAIPLTVSLQDKKNAPQGEKHLYPIKQELADYWKAFYTAVLEKLYAQLTVLLDLPAVSAETVQKAFREAEHPRDAQGRFTDKTAEKEASFNEYMLTHKGSKDFGEISPLIASYIKRQPGKIRLRIGKQENSTGDYGVKHIERSGRIKQLQDNGYNNAQSFVEDVAENFSAIYEGKGRSLILYKEDTIGAAIFIQLDPAHEDFYDVKTGMITRPSYIKNKKLLWSKNLSSLKEEPSEVRSPHTEQYPSAHSSGSSLPSIAISPENASHIQKSLVSDMGKKIHTLVNRLFGSFKLRYKGAIIYNPETGQPLRRRDFTRLITAIEQVLQTNTTDAAKQLTLDSVTISKLLHRMAQYQTTSKLNMLTLDTLTYKNKPYNWIRKDYHNLSTVLERTLSKQELARYQVCEDTAAQLITRVNDTIRNGIKEVLLHGISERKSKAQVSQELFQKFGSLNRSWKRIAETETVNIANLASILEEVHTAQSGEKVYFKRYEMASCCEHCQKADGVIAIWSDTPLEDDRITDEYAQVALWEGKKPDIKNGVLVIGALHPHCRGFWVRWGASAYNAQAATLNGKSEQWNAAVEKARTEYAEQGIAEPHDGTQGYIVRINEIYKTQALR